MKVFSEVLGRYIEIPDEPKIVSLAPSITDTLYQLKADKFVGGVSYFCRRPLKRIDKMKVGGYINVNYELLKQINPDIIFITTGIQRKLIFELIENGFNVYPIPLPISTFGIIDNVVLIGTILKKYDDSLLLAKKLINRLVKIAEETKLSVYYEVDLGEPITIGAFSYINNSLEIIGLNNIFSKVPSAYITPDFNKVAEINPDILIFEDGSKKIYSKFLNEILYKRKWTELEAVKNNRIIILESDSLAHYGPYHIKALELLKEEIIDIFR